MTVWRANSVEKEPLTTMNVWCIYRAYFNEDQTDYSDHVVGYCGEGRASSKIIEWDDDLSIATTRSGRRYLLRPDLIGFSDDADYVWRMWRFTNKVVKYEDVTDLYIRRYTE